MAESYSNNAASQFNLNEVLKNQYEYLKKNYTAAENGQEAMLNRELENAKKAVEGEGFLGLTLKQKINDMMPSELLQEEFKKVAIDTLTAAIQPFLDYLEKNEVAFNPVMFQEQINADAKQLFYAQLALKKESEQNQSGQRFVATY